MIRAWRIIGRVVTASPIRATVVTGVLCLAAVAAWGQTVRLEETAAGQAFKARQYEAALVEFQKLAAANPGDVLVQRYLALTLDRLGRYREAIEAFQRALALAPDNAATHYHLGTTYYKAGAPDLADANLRRALRLGPDTLYAGLARQYLDVIAQERLQLQRAGAPPPVGFSLTVGVQQDSNIPAAPADRSLFDGPRAGLRVFEQLAAEYRFLRAPGWLGSIDASSYQSEYPGGGFQPFQLSTYGVGGTLQQTTALGGLPVTGSLRYEHIWALLDGDQFSRTHVVTLGSQIGLTANTTTSLYYRYARDDFEEEGFQPDLSSRDGNAHTFGLAQIWYFAGRRGLLRLGYEFQHNDTEGRNFDMDGHQVSLGAAIPLWWGIQADLGVAYAHERYPDFQGVFGKRETDRWTAEAGLSRWLSRHLRLNLNYAYVDEDSNYAILSYRRWVTGVSLSYVY
jgi:tetratricopeptide (TPR) repeat protein